jgi:alpha-D-xyloside xylohydrolase
VASIFTTATSVRWSLPMMRALVLDYQDDPTTYNLSDEFLFGDDLLVAPVVTADPRRKVYLPEGTWTCWWTGERLRGPRWIDVRADLEIIPLYIREGGIIPLGPVMNYVDEKPLDRLEVRLGFREGDGRSSTRLTVNGRDVQLTYETAGGRHVLRASVSPVPVSVSNGKSEIIHE